MKYNTCMHVLHHVRHIWAMRVITMNVTDTGTDTDMKSDFIIPPEHASFLNESRHIHE